MPPRNHEAGAPHPTMGPMPPPQAQQAMRMGSMGVGIYPGVMPYGVLPGMHHQVRLMAKSFQVIVLQLFIHPVTDWL